MWNLSYCFLLDLNIYVFLAVWLYGLSMRWSVHHFNPDWNISTTIVQKNLRHHQYVSVFIYPMKCLNIVHGTNIHCSQRLNPGDFFFSATNTLFLLICSLTIGWIVTKFPLSGWTWWVPSLLEPHQVKYFHSCNTLIYIDVPTNPTSVN